jgi:hypothetical protein
MERSPPQPHSREHIVTSADDRARYAVYLERRRAAEHAYNERRRELWKQLATANAEYEAAIAAIEAEHRSDK